MANSTQDQPDNILAGKAVYHNDHSRFVQEMQQPILCQTEAKNLVLLTK